MKEKMIIFLVGLLVGAIISTGSIYVYTLIDTSKSIPNEQMPNKDRLDDNNPPKLPNSERAN